jgi:hypothetical protein
LQSIRGITPTKSMRETPTRMAAIRRDRGVRGTDTPFPEQRPTSESWRAPVPTLVLFSTDKELTALARKTVKAPWRIELCEDPAIDRGALSRPSVRVVIVDDGAVDEEARGWLLDRIREFVPQALLIYIASAHTEADERRARGYSAQYYTAKPLDTDRTARVIESFVRTAAARDGGVWQS